MRGDVKGLKCPSQSTASSWRHSSVDEGFSTSEDKLGK